MKITRRHWLIALLSVLGILLLSLDITLHAVQRQRITNLTADKASAEADSRADLKAANERYTRLFDNYTNLYKQLGDTGVKPSAPAPSSVTQPERGEAGPKGDTGQVGPGPSDDQVANIVGEYCSIRAYCAGPVGPPGQTVVGPKGDKGDPGETVVGPVGPIGPKGDKGDPGASGVPLSITCFVGDDGLTTALEFTYPAGVVFDVDAPCTPPVGALSRK